MNDFKKVIKRLEIKVDRKVEKVAQSSRYQSVSYQSAIGRFPDALILLGVFVCSFRLRMPLPDLTLATV